MSARQHLLPNGTRLILDPAPGARTIAVTAAVEGGARWEDEARSGWSHLLEHLVFKGAGGRDARALIERIEAAGGSLNADTGQERTAFHARVLEGDLELALSALSDLLFRPHLEPAEIAREKDVVAQEIAEAWDTPDDCVFDLAQGQAFAGQPLGRPILGTVESLEAADRTAMEAWRRRLYAPERMAVAVSGAVDEAELLRLCELWFGEPPSGEADRPEPARFVGGQAGDARRIEQANLVFQLPGLAVGDPDLPALALLVEILGGGMASRLFQEAREDRGLAYAVDAGFESFLDGGLVNVFSGTAPGKAVEMAELTAAAFLRLTEGVTDAELGRAKAQALSGLYLSQENLANRADRLAAQALVWGRPIPVEETAEKVQAVSAGDLKRVAGRLLEPRRSSAAVVGPKGASRAAKAFAQALG